VNDLAAGLTDVALTAVLLACAVRLGRTPGVHRYWPRVFCSAGAAALAGAAHHLVLRDLRRAYDLSWVAVGVLVAAAISWMLAASAADLLDPPMARLFTGLAVVSLVAYLTAVIAQSASTTGLLVLSQGTTMAAIVGMWLWAWSAGHAGAPRMLAGFAVCALSSIFYTLPAATYPSSLQHLGQIPGVLLLTRALLDGPLPRRAPHALDAG
jgi:hypothetical protein